MARIDCGLPSPFDPTTVGAATVLAASPAFPVNTTSGTDDRSPLDLTQQAIYSATVRHRPKLLPLVEEYKRRLAELTADEGGRVTHEKGDDATDLRKALN
jgi:hypothetical protein